MHGLKVHTVCKYIISYRNTNSYMEENMLMSLSIDTEILIPHIPKFCVLSCLKLSIFNSVTRGRCEFLCMKRDTGDTLPIPACHQQRKAI